MFSYICSNLVILGQIFLIIGFTTPNWQGYNDAIIGNVSYSGHQGLWTRHSFNNSVTCSGDVDVGVATG